MHEVCRIPRAYLPLETFRGKDSVPGPDGTAVARTFRSSGTTQAERARATYSQEGLAACREGSLSAFQTMLKKVADGGAPITAGISLIPAVSVWPDSSLAQMVEWIADVMRVAYADQETIAGIIGQAGGAPIFVFGTAFHFVHLIDSGFSAKLPPGSIVIETGGTKGRSRAISRDDLYSEISTMFDVAEERIVSEYGMCELASQAYDVASPGEQERTFRFPPWVEACVLTGVNQLASSGRGALVVKDAKRIDLDVPLRTEDLVDLNADGSFTLLGRLDGAPLRGCSLGAEFAATEHFSAPVGQTAALVTASGDAARADAFLHFFDEFLADPATLDALTRELGSAAAATAALEDLAVSAPQSREDWLNAAGSRQTSRHWLLILPENHTLVGIYPVALGYVLGLDLTVRVPRRFETGANLLTLFLERMANLPDAHVGTIPANFRIGRSSVDDGAVLCYGSDETVATIRSLLPGRLVQGFGNQIGYTVLAAGETQEALPRLARDAFGLAQRGCLSTRFVVVIDDGSLNEGRLAEGLARVGAEFWGKSLDWRDRVGMDAAAIELDKADFKVRAPQLPDDPLIATLALPTLQALTPRLVQSATSRHPFVLPVVILHEQISPSLVKAALSSERTAGGLGEGLSFREVGEANRPIWDGSHAGRRLYSPYN